MEYIWQIREGGGVGGKMSIYEKVVGGGGGGVKPCVHVHKQMYTRLSILLLDVSQELCSMYELHP